MYIPNLTTLFYIDALSIIMLSLIGFITVLVASFAHRYFSGSTDYTRFFITLGALTTTLCILVTANHLALFAFAWFAGNVLLVRLMIPSSSWRAAHASGMYALTTFSIGLLLLSAGFVALYLASGSALIHTITASSFTNQKLLSSALFLIFLGASTQSALWPFHRWLLSSLNSPTPVSAFMHAGLINGSGFLVARLAPLYLASPYMLTYMLIIGMITVVLGTLYKLIQNDIKRAFAASTMSQMGFMIVQCGLGLCAAAVTHLVWHGMVKAYLFLSSGSAAQQTTYRRYASPLLSYLVALISGVIGSWCFAYISTGGNIACNTSLVLFVVAGVAGAQCVIPLVHNNPIKKLPIACVITATAGVLYGYNVRLIETLLEPLHLMQPQPLAVIHVIIIAIIILGWLGINAISSLAHTPAWYNAWYVTLLNASQPAPTTITAHRNSYAFKGK